MVLCAVQSLYRHGRLKMYSSQATIRQSTSEDGIFIVGSGLVRVTYQDMADSSHEYYLGTGQLPNLQIWPCQLVHVRQNRHHARECLCSNAAALLSTTQLASANDAPLSAVLHG